MKQTDSLLLAALAVLLIMWLVLELRPHPKPVRHKAVSAPAGCWLSPTAEYWRWKWSDLTCAG